MPAEIHIQMLIYFSTINITVKPEDGQHKYWHGVCIIVCLIVDPEKFLVG